MNYTVVIDWKFIAAAGLATAGIIFAIKIPPERAGEVFIHAIDTCRNEFPAIKAEC